MGKVNRILLMLIAMMAIMIAAVGLNKASQYYQAQQWEAERVERYEQAYEEASEIQMIISELSQDQQAIENFIEENQEYFDEKPLEEEQTAELMHTVSENQEKAWTSAVSENSITDSTISEDAVSENAISQNTTSDNILTDATVSHNTVSDNTISENTISENTISENTIPENIISENTISQNTVSQNQLTTVSGNDLTLQEKRSINTSYIETQNVSKMDQQIIAGCETDFSEITIACLGDSITAASNLEKLENYQQYSYPARLKEILGAKEVYNLGIGGSSIGRYWENAFVDRYQEIPQDTDIILVMGGTNDGFCINQEEMGTFEERKPDTFIGDLDELMRGLKADYPDAMIIFATPLPNVLHDMLRKERDYLLPQKEIADAIKILATEYEIPVIDLYNSNILDSHDAAIIFNYMPDGVHGNQEGYQILAEHMAAEIIQLYKENDVQNETEQE